MYETILVPTDGSEHAERAARHAFSLAAAFDATVSVLGVADFAAAAGPFDAGGVSEAFVDRVEDEVDAAVDDATALAPDDVRVDRTVVDGTPTEEILAYADRHDVDLIAMGTRGRRGLRRFVAGSVTEHVLRGSEVPVLTVRHTDDPAVTDYERVLVPTDGSDAAAAAIDHGIAVADAYDATLHALSVVDVGTVAAGSDVAPATDLLGTLRERGEAATDRIASRGAEAGVDVVTEVREGFPNSDLLTYVDEAGVDFVAMGTHGRTGIDRLLLGSTTERTVRRASVPVLSVHPDERGSSE